MYKIKTSGLLKGVQLAAMLLIGTSASAANYGYDGDITLCTGTCDSFAALELGSTVDADLTIDVAPSSSFSAADVLFYSFEITSGAALEPYTGLNPTTANPLPIDDTIAALRDSNVTQGTTTGGTTDASGELVSGTLLFEFLNPPFSDNGAWVILDIATGSAQVCLFYETAGCIPGATEAVIVSGAFSLVPPADYLYDGAITLCTGTCDSFAALETGSTVNADLTIDVASSSSFTAADVLVYNFEITSSATLEPYTGANPTTANPLPIDATIAALRDSNVTQGTTTGGTTDAGGELDSGTLLFEFLNPPFSDNGAWVIIDIATGVAQVCLFYETAGCIPGATEAVVVNGSFSLDTGAPDSDGDGVGDDVDNCLLVSNADQRDTNGDGFGNICDTDLNNDCIANPIDLGLFKLVFFASNADADFNGDGVVNPIDLGIFKSRFFQPPGPNASGVCP